MIRLVLLLCSLAWPVTRTHQELIDLVGRKGDITHLYDLYKRADWATPEEYGGLSAAIDAIGAAKKTLLIADTITLTASDTVPTNVALFVVPGGYFTGAYTLTIRGAFIAGAHKVFDTTMTASLSRNSAREMLATWWGPTGDGVTDDSPYIRRAVAALGWGGTLTFLPPDSTYRLQTRLEIADKQGATINFAPPLETSPPEIPDVYPFTYQGPVLTGYDSAVVSIVGCSYSRFNGLAIHANSRADYALWLSGVNYYQGAALTTANRYRAIGNRLDRFANLGANKVGARFGDDDSSGSQTDLTTITNSFFRAPETSPQIGIDSMPVSRAVEIHHANTYAKFEHCEFGGGDAGVFINSGTTAFDFCYVLGDARAGWVINEQGALTTLSSCHAEGILGRPVHVLSGDAASARILKIIGGDFLPGSKAEQTWDANTSLNLTSDKIRITGHPYATDDIVILTDGSGTLPTSSPQVVDGGMYWVEKASADSIKLRSTLGGSAINFTAAGSGTMTLTYRPPPIRLQGNQMTTMIGVFAEGWIADTVFTNEDPVILDLGNKWLHPTDYGNLGLPQVLSYSTFSGAASPAAARTGAPFSSQYIRWGSGSPEGVIYAPVGTIYHRTNGGAGTSLYVKESGAGNTGWVAK